MRRLLCWLLTLGCSPGVSAGLVADGTRVIYPADADARSVLIANTNPWPVLVQTWVDDGAGDANTADAPFVVMPAVFRLEPAATRRLHLMPTGDELPADRESLFWLVPPADAGMEAEAARLTVTLTTQLKLLYRPAGVGAPETQAAQLQFRRRVQDGREVLQVLNPTPWFASLGTLNMGGVDAAGVLLPPFSARDCPLPAGAAETEAPVQFSLIGDHGFSTFYQKHLERMALDE